MPATADTIELYVEQLEEDADEIVEMIDRLYHEAEKGHKLVRGNFPIGAASRGDTKRIWEDPEGETKELQDELRAAYESWYARAEELITKHLHTRLDDFERRRSQMKDYARLSVNANHDPEHYVNNAADMFAEQRNIVKAIPAKVEAEKLSLRRQVSDAFAQDDLLQARDLLDEELNRAAGVVAGVALERHLQTECDEAELEYDHKDGIASLAQTLYEAGEINSTTLSNLETLGQIRNDCAHANQEEPNEHKVKKIIDDTDDYVRGWGI